MQKFQTIPKGEVPQYRVRQVPQSLWGLLFLERRRVILGVFTLLLEDILQYGIPYVLKVGVDELQRGEATFLGLLRWGLVILGLGLGVVFLRVLWRRTLLVASRRVEAWLRDRLYAHILTLDATFFQRTSLGEVMAHLTNDMEAIRMALAFGLIAFVDFLLYTLFSIGAMSLLSVKLMVVALLPLLPLTFHVLVVGRQIHRVFRRVQAAFGDLTEETRKILSNIRMLKAYRQEQGVVRYYAGHNERFVRLNLVLARLSALFEPTIQTLSSLGALLVLVYGGRLVARGELSLGSFVAFFSYLGMMVWPMMALGFTVNLYQRANASLRRVLTLLEEKPRIQSPPDAHTGRMKGDVSIQNLSFRYPDAPEDEYALWKVDLAVPAGTFLGITGPTSGGKTTLLRLLFRFLDPPPGTIRIDGIDIRKWDLTALRHQIGYVPQEPLLFSATVRENLLLARPDATEEELQDVLEIAGIAGEVDLDTVIGEKGVTLSGGQKQRLSIARALLKRPRIYLMDDPLSHVDAEKEQEILQKLLPRLREEKATVFWVAHRVSQLLEADRVVVLSDGVIRESGAPGDLLARDSVFAALFRLQTAQDPTPMHEEGG